MRKLAYEKENKHLFTAKNIKYYMRICYNKKKIDN